MYGIPYLVSRGVFVSPENPCTFILTTNAPEGADITVNYTDTTTCISWLPTSTGTASSPRPLSRGGPFSSHWRWLAPSGPRLREQAGRMP